jgi:iron complex outermembrane receptor protein
LRSIDYKSSGSTSNVDQLLFDKKYSFFNPKAGLNFEMNKENRIYFSLARAFREPTRSDFENNINIQPEELIDYELGWNFTSEKFYFGSNLYYMKYKNQLVLTGSIDDVGTPIRDNSGESYRKGIELESAYVFSDKINISGNMSFSKNKNVDYVTNLNGQSVNLGDTDISFSPKLISSVQISYDPSPNFNISLLNKFVGEQYMSNTESDFSRLDSYTTTDLSIKYKFDKTSLFSDIVVTAMINNIFNVEYVSNGYYYTYDDTWSDPNLITTIEGTGYFPQATRNFLLGITFKL